MAAEGKANFKSLHEIFLFFILIFVFYLLAEFSKHSSRNLTAPPIQVRERFRETSNLKIPLSNKTTNCKNLDKNQVKYEEIFSCDISSAIEGYRFITPHKFNSNGKEIISFWSKLWAKISFRSTIHTPINT